MLVIIGSITDTTLVSVAIFFRGDIGSDGCLGRLLVFPIGSAKIQRLCSGYVPWPIWGLNLLLYLVRQMVWL